MRLFVFFIGLFLFCQNIFGQVYIDGQIENTKGESISRINVLFYLPETKSLIAFAVSDQDGNFQTTVDSPSDSLYLEISSVQYRNEYRSIKNTSQSLQFELEYDTKQLETFTVSAAPIETRGDTISYLVSSFAGKEDRVIEDVLKNMPGIEVEPDGRILYEGVPLKKFYVEGLDLMEGRYGVVSKNLPHGSVSTVEILENHQPIRILEDRVTSQQASLNLKLKKGITTTGTSKLGIGANPLLWDINITPMTFMKNFQVVSSYQANNTGNDVARQLHVFTFDDLIKSADRPNEHPEMLDIQTANPPDIDEDRYLDNNIHLLNFNTLQRLSNDMQLRTNIFYVNDFQKQVSTVRRVYLNPTDTLEFTENLNNKTHNNYLHSEFSLNRNVKKNYFKNVLKIKSSWDTKTGLVDTGEDEIQQSLNNPITAISNDLLSTNSIGKHLVEFQSYISYDHSPHNLSVNPGPYEQAINNGEPYPQAQQQFNLNRFFADQSAGLVLGWKRLSINPHVGFSYRQQLLESNIIKTFNGEESQVGTDFINELEGKQTRIYFNTNIEYRKSGLTVKVKLPLNWQKVSLADSVAMGGQSISKFCFDPGLSADYKFSGFWRIRGSWKFINRIGDIDRVHYGYILKNHHFLTRNSAPLSESYRHNLAIFLSYRDPINSFFNSVSYLYTINNTNQIYSTVIQDDGTSIVQSLFYENYSNSHSFQGRTSKYFSAIKSTVGFHFSFNQYMGKSLMNDELFNTTNVFYILSPELNFKITHWMNAEYNLSANYIRTFIEEERKSNISMLKHHFNIFAFPAESQMLSLETEYYNNNDNNNFFADLAYTYTLKKQKIDLELKCKNIFNNKTYINYSANAFTIWESSYAMRPSQILVSVKFSF